MEINKPIIQFINQIYRFKIFNCLFLINFLLLLYRRQTHWVKSEPPNIPIPINLQVQTNDIGNSTRRFNFNITGNISIIEIEYCFGTIIKYCFLNINFSNKITRFSGDTF